MYVLAAGAPMEGAPPVVMQRTESDVEERRRA
jgi:hypothetical protein